MSQKPEVILRGGSLPNIHDIKRAEANNMRHFIWRWYCWPTAKGFELLFHPMMRFQAPANPGAHLKRQLLELRWSKLEVQCGLPVGAGWSEDRANTRVLTLVSRPGVHNGLLSFYPAHPHHPPNGLSELLQLWLRAPVPAISPLLFQSKYLSKCLSPPPRCSGSSHPLLDYLTCVQPSSSTQLQGRKGKVQVHSLSPGWRWCWEDTCLGKTCTLGSALSQVLRPGRGSDRWFSSISF